MHPVRKAILVVCILLPFLATLSVYFRFRARRTRKLPLLLDDWSALVALLLTIASSLATFYAVRIKGLGLGPKQLERQDVVPAFKLFYAIMLLVYLTFGIIKISFIWFYKRIFPGRNFHILSNILIIAVIGWTIVGFTLQALNSWNTPGFWNFKLLDYGVLNLTMAVLDLAFDVSILLLPLPPISKLQVSRRKKYALLALFWLGSICIIASALRVYYNYEFYVFRPADDSAQWGTYISSSNSLMIAIECNMSIIAACLPTLGGFVKSQVKLSSTRPYSDITSRLSRFLKPNRYPRRSSAVSSEATAPWVPLQEHPPKAYINNRPAHDVEFDRSHAQGIIINRTFELEHTSV